MFDGGTMPAPISAASGAQLLVNPALDRSRPYSEAERAILSREAAEEACAMISAWPGYQPTPLRSLPALARDAGVGEILYKDEGLRFGLGSFKALGGAYAVQRLTAQRGGAKGLTVACATDGNHGRAVAWGARTLGANAVIYLHEQVSAGREAAIRDLGAETRRVPGNYDHSVRVCAEEAERHSWTVVSDTSWPGYEAIPRDVMQGYALLALEAEAQGARPTHVFVQGGVGGIAAAVLSHFWEALGAARPVLIVVEPENAACLFESARHGRPTVVGGALDTIMAGLACGEASPLAWRLLETGADAFITIPDASAAVAMRRLARAGVVGGESGVAGLAGLLALDQPMRAALRLDGASRVLCIGTEGATDPQIYQQIVGETPRSIGEREPA